MNLFTKTIIPLHSWDAYLAACKKIANNKKRSFLYISSFGLSIMPEVQEEIINLNPDKMLVGTHFPECKPGCTACDSKNRDRFNNLRKFQEEVKFDVKICDSLHLKVVVSDSSMIIGGINMTGSGWADSSVLINDSSLCKKYKRRFNDIWRNKPGVVYEPQSNDYIFAFGIHKGLSFSTVKKMDPQYIQWCLKNLSWFKELVADLDLVK